jgi:hypothetical protein
VDYGLPSVLHNYLSLMGEDDDWLESMIEDEEGSDHVPVEPQSNTTADSSMREVGEARRNSIREKLQEESLFV